MGMWRYKAIHMIGAPKIQIKILVLVNEEGGSMGFYDLGPGYGSSWEPGAAGGGRRF